MRTSRRARGQPAVSDPSTRPADLAHTDGGDALGFAAPATGHEAGGTISLADASRSFDVVLSQR